MDATFNPIIFVLATAVLIIAFIVYAVKHPPKPIAERVQNWAKVRSMEILTFEVNPSNRPFRLCFDLFQRRGGTLCRIVVRDSDQKIRGAWVRFYHSGPWTNDQEEVWWITSPVTAPHEQHDDQAH